MKTYRFSCLASGFVRMWRAWIVILLVVVVNALLQALLIWPPFTYGSGVWTTISAVVFLYSPETKVASGWLTAR